MSFRALRGSEEYEVCDGATTLWSYDSPARGGLLYPYRQGRVAKVANSEHSSCDCNTSRTVLCRMLYGLILIGAAVFCGMQDLPPQAYLFAAHGVSFRMEHNSP